MDALQDRWQRASRGVLHKTLTITDAGVLLGCGTVLVRRSAEDYALDADSDRCLFLLSIARKRSQAPAALQCLRSALASWQRGDKALAHIYLAFGRLPTIEGLEDARRLHQAEELLDLGMAPRALAKELGVDLRLPPISRVFNPAEPRNPKGSGAGGEWTKDPVAAGSIAFAPELIADPAKKPAASPAPTQNPSTASSAPAQDPTTARMLTPAVPSLVDTLGAEAVDWLIAVAGRLALPAAAFGAVFVPSPSGGTSEQGAVPDRPGMSYRLDRDTGTLRLSLDSDPDPDHALVALLGSDGVYRDVETKVAIARAVGSEAVLIDLDLAPAALGGGAPGTGFFTDGPKLCPDPSKDQGGGRKLFDIMYEQFVRDHVNPQRKPQLPPGLAFTLPADTPSGWVHYDDCREATGAMIEAKGNYAGMVASEGGQRILRIRWLSQAENQINGANGRPIEWYFNDYSAAAFASAIFSVRGYDKNISIHVLPYPGGVPKFNPRIKL